MIRLCSKGHITGYRECATCGSKETIPQDGDHSARGEARLTDLRRIREELIKTQYHKDLLGAWRREKEAERTSFRIRLKQWAAIHRWKKTQVVERRSWNSK